MKFFSFVLAAAALSFSCAQAQTMQPTASTALSNNNTFSAAASFAPPVGVLFAICGSATKVIHLIGVNFSGTDTTSSTITVSMLRTSTAPSAGTVLPNVSWDTNNSAPTATVQYYTAAPTPGTSLGALRVFDLSLPSGTTATGTQGAITVQPSPFGSPVALRGTNQCVEFYTASSTTGVTIQVSQIWYETAY